MQRILLLGLALTTGATAQELMALERASGERLPLIRKNLPDNAQTTVVYQEDYGTRTDNRPDSQYVQLERLSPTDYRVTQQGTGNSLILPQGMVLSLGATGLQRDRDFLRQLQPGETLTLHYPPIRQTTQSLTALNPTASALQRHLKANPAALVMYPATPDRIQRALAQSGYHVRIENGLITGIANADDTPSPTEYWLSAYGSTKAWLIANGRIGVQVLPQGAQLTLQQTAASQQQSVTDNLAAATAALAQAQRNPQLIALDSPYPPTDPAHPLQVAAQALAQAEQAAATSRTVQDTPRRVEASKASLRAANTSRYALLPSNPAEERGIRYIPEPNSSLADIEQTLERIATTGFTTLYLELEQDGYSLYPSTTLAGAGLASQHPAYAKQRYGTYRSDIIAAIVNTAKKYKLQVYGRSRLLQQLTARSTSAQPWHVALPATQRLLVSYYQELTKKYRLNGLLVSPTPQLATSAARHNDSPAVRQLAQRELGFDSRELTSLSQAQQYRWDAWLAKKETQLWQQLKQQLKQASPSVMLAAHLQQPERLAPYGTFDVWLVANPTPALQAAALQQGKILLKYSPAFQDHWGEHATLNAVRPSALHAGVVISDIQRASVGNLAALQQGYWKMPAQSPLASPRKASAALFRHAQNIMQATISPGNAPAVLNAPLSRKTLADLNTLLRTERFAAPIQQRVKPYLARIAQWQAASDALGNR